MRPFRSDAAVEIIKATARKRSCFRSKKRQPSAIASAGAVLSQGLLSCHGSDFGASGVDDLVGGAEDFLGAQWEGIISERGGPCLIITGMDCRYLARRILKPRGLGGIA
jgi:hypothetical protein